MPGAQLEADARAQPKKGYKTFPMGGWVMTGEPCRMQRVDQGQDLEIPRGHHIHAPGPGVCIAHGSDGAFPNGFGSPYAIVKIEHGPFDVGDGEWYVGHANKDVIAVGKRFEFGDPLAKANNGFDPDWGWVEIGKAGNGGFLSTNGAKFHHLFIPVKRRWPR